MTTRAEHLAWCKERALEYVDQGNLAGALASMTQDTAMRADTTNEAGAMLGMMELMAGTISTPDQMRRHIEGYQ